MISERSLMFPAWAAIFGLMAMASTSLAEDDRASDRAAMIDEITETFRATAEYVAEPPDGRVLEAMRRVARHELVPPGQRRHAYQNRPLPIGHGQTISQPYIVALMTTLLRPQPQHRILEIGTGSGYQAAVLAELVESVHTIEIIEPLGERAQRDLERLGYRNIFNRIGDGYYGWPDQAPFDGIVVTAAASHVPPPLIQQLKPGGRMVIPVGSRFMTQQLVLVEKDAAGQVRTRQMLPVRFVPLTGGPQ